MQEAETDPDLQECIAEYAHGRGALAMQEICWGRGELFMQMAWEQDEIGWRRFMEGMIGRIMRRYSGCIGYALGQRCHWSGG